MSHGGTTPGAGFAVGTLQAVDLFANLGTFVVGGLFGTSDAANTCNLDRLELELIGFPDSE
jgi:hypothetical protein